MPLDPKGLSYKLGKSLRTRLRIGERKSASHPSIFRGGFLVNRHIDRFVTTELRKFVAPGLNILDIGCGSQPFRSMCEGAGAHYFGIDISSSSGQRVDALASALFLPFATSSVDIVICTEVLEHVPDPIKVVSEWSRVLRPGGTAIVTTPFMFGLHEVPNDFQRITEFGLQSLSHSTKLTLGHSTRFGNEFEVVASTLETFLNHRLKARGLVSVVVLGMCRLIINMIALLPSGLMRNWKSRAYLGTGAVFRLAE